MTDRRKRGHGGAARYQPKPVRMGKRASETLGDSSGAKKDSVGFLTMAESYAKATAFVTGTLLSVSVFYDYNFLRALSLSFGDVPTTISDHVRTAILWLPPAKLAGFFMGIVSLTLRVYFGEWFIPGLGQLTQEQLAVLTDHKGTTPASGLPARRMSNKLPFLTALLMPILFSLIPILADIIGWGRLYLNFMVLWFLCSYKKSTSQSSSLPAQSAWLSDLCHCSNHVCICWKDRV